MEPAPENPWQSLRGFVTGMGVWIGAFAIQFFMAASSGSRMALAVCPVLLSIIVTYYFLNRHRRPSFTNGLLLALCLAILLSSACGIKIAWEGFGG